MLLNRHVTVVLPAYNAGLTLRRTYAEVDREVVDRVILVDDCSRDGTVALAEELGIEEIVVHAGNRGYGANQKSCYRRALELGTDIVIMLHPDYQYTPKLVPALAAMVASDEYDLVLGSRITGDGARKGGMPLYKYVANRALTAFQNLALGMKLSEYHTGYRAYGRELLEAIPLDRNSDGFVFDNQVIVQARAFGFRIGEISCPARYFDGASSISFRPAVRYGLGVLATSLQYRLHAMHLLRPRFLQDEPDAGARERLDGERRRTG